MATQLFNTSGDMGHLHRLVTRITLVGALASGFILSVVGVLTGNTGFLWEAVGPTLTGLLVLPMVLLKRESAAVTFTLATISVVVTFKLVGSPDTTVAATTAIVIMASLSTLFLVRHVAAKVAVGALAIALVPVLWVERLEGALSAGLVMALSFSVASVAFILVKNAAGEVNSRYRLAFVDAPVALLELDWSDALDYLADRGVTDVAEAMKQDPRLVGDLVERTCVVRANGEAARLFEVSEPSDLEGSVARPFAGGPAREWWAAQFVAQAEGRTETDAEVSLAGWGLEKQVAIRTITGHNPTGVNSSIVALNDITAARLYEKSLTDLIDAKDEFIATVSHELRTPLTAVVGLASLLAGEERLPEAEQADLLDIVASQSREISFIVEDLLVAARADIGRITVVAEQVDPVRIAKEVASELSADAPIAVEDEGLGVLGDPVRMRQVIRNLLVNAERYGGARRRIVIYARNEQVLIEVRDSGEPIPQAARDRIFEPYERAHDREGRTVAMGLGLSVSRRLARLMNGDLEYVHDGESVFRLSLPQAVEEVAAEDHATSQPAGVSGL